MIPLDNSITLNHWATDTKNFGSDVLSDPKTVVYLFLTSSFLLFFFFFFYAYFKNMGAAVWVSRPRTAGSVGLKPAAADLLNVY